MADIFAQAGRQKVRFESPCGLLSVEDLWDLPLTANRGTSLDMMARGLYKALQEAKGLSFVDDPPPENTLVQLKFDVVTHIIAVKKAEKQAALQEADKAARKARLLDVLARKQDAALEGLSEEELQRMLAEL